VADQSYDWRETCFDKWPKLKVEELIRRATIGRETSATAVASLLERPPTPSPVKIIWSKATDFHWLLRRANQKQIANFREKYYMA
jgi:hypothetical protein